MKSFNVTFTLREAFQWFVIAALAAGLIAEHFTARSFEQDTRDGVRQALEQLFSHPQ